jgi:hypothetical protein
VLVREALLPHGEAGEALPDHLVAVKGGDAAAGANGAVLVSLSVLPLDDSLFSGDGFHPSSEGYARLADAFWGEIAPRL